jgi:hypothetical protein
VKQKLAVALALLCGPFLAAAHTVSLAEDVANTGVEAQKSETIQLDPLDVVIVNGHQVKLHELRKEIEKAEEAFYDAFNRVNTDPQYETHCLNEVSTDGRSREHMCKPQFVHAAGEAEAQAFIGEKTVGNVEKGGRTFGGIEGYRARPATMVINEKMPGYKRHMRDLVEKDPNLRKALAHYYSLTERYDAIRKDKRKGKWFSWD